MRGHDYSLPHEPMMPLYIAAWGVECTPTQKIVLLCLVRWANNEGLTLASTEMLCNLTGLKERAVRTARKALQATGLIVPQPEICATAYRIILPLSMPPRQEESPEQGALRQMPIQRKPMPHRGEAAASKAMKVARKAASSVSMKAEEAVEAPSKAENAAEKESALSLPLPSPHTPLPTPTHTRKETKYFPEGKAISSILAGDAADKQQLPQQPHPRQANLAAEKGNRLEADLRHHDAEERGEERAEERGEERAEGRVRKRSGRRLGQRVLRRLGAGKGAYDVARGDDFPVLPSWIPLSTWNDFADMRHEMGKPLTPRAVRVMLKNLTQWRAEGFDPEEIINNAIANSWRGLFKPPGWQKTRARKARARKGGNDQTGSRHARNGTKGQQAEPSAGDEVSMAYTRAMRAWSALHEQHRDYGHINRIWPEKARALGLPDCPITLESYRHYFARKNARKDIGKNAGEDIGKDRPG